nr:putative inositol polyphosphate 5-phosphatase c9g1.10c [Quercus suber]
MDIRNREHSGTDASSIKPVSSLRSKFENIHKTDDASQSHSASRPTLQPLLSANQAVPAQRPRTSAGDAIHPSLGGAGGIVSSLPRQNVGVGTSSPPRSRPQSMVLLGPPFRPVEPPIVTTVSPHSPKTEASYDYSSESTPDHTRERLKPLTKMHARALGKPGKPMPSAPMPTSMSSERSVAPLNDFSHPDTRGTDNRPVVNRAAKPRIPIKPVALTQQSVRLAAPGPVSTDLTDRSTSPFNTPPSSREDSPEASLINVMPRPRNDSDASWVERIRSNSTTSSPRRGHGYSELLYEDHARGIPTVTLTESSSHPERRLQRQRHTAAPTGIDQSDNHVSQDDPGRSRPVSRRPEPDGDTLGQRPPLPVRPELQVGPHKHSPPNSRISYIKPDFETMSSDSGHPSPSHNKQNATFQRTSTMAEYPKTHRGYTPKPAQDPSLYNGIAHDLPRKTAPEIPAPRRSMETRTNAAKPTSMGQLDLNADATDDVVQVLPLDVANDAAVSASEFPDTSQASRRPPRYTTRPHHLPTDYDTRLIATCGSYVCTSGYITKAWNLRTGAQLLNLNHNEGTRVTSLVFKPTSVLQDEGKRVWLGTSSGEIHEVDIPGQALIKTKVGAHARREITRMFRHASELWTLDDGGDLNVWRPDHKGMPSLDSHFNTFRIPKAPTFTMACGEHIWVAYGKSLRVFRPGARSDSEFQASRGAITQPSTGDITSGTTLSSKPGLVYLGHLDGKVSIYSRKDISCVAVVSISLYKVSTLAGVGDYLWAGYSTGMIYVYDTSTTPWKVRKDWQAHEKQICSIVVDPSALWKLDRLQVISLGMDNIIRVWDGLLEEDWLDDCMLAHDSEYCTFRELSVAVLTWNAGASKPQYLQGSMDDSNFLYEYLNTGKSADILVFGFQELVDLEDKKVTAKSFFKSKKKDPREPEHMSHQYRAWRDYLIRCVENFTGPTDTYTLLHTASLVGLFSCIFVRSSERSRIRHMHTAEVKRGMGGLHGNKGALVTRMILDDSSVCFVNCHLAAGQTQTINRNNDVAAILEAEALPAYPLGQNDLAHHNDVFIAGGNGSMILDHEICVFSGDLNYRIDTMGRETVVKYVASNNLARLLERDQLLLSRKKNPHFRLRSFTESPIKFAPTYKYNVHTNDYDTSEKRRAPAWCDRILYRGLGKIKMEDENYRRWEVRVSDHRPVSGRLRMRVKTIDPARRRLRWQACVEAFETARTRVAKNVEVAYLTDVLGMTAGDADIALRSS